MSNLSSDQSAVVSSVISAPAPIKATAVVQPSIFSDLISSLGSTAPVANTIVSVLSHLGLSGAILSGVGEVAAMVEQGSGVDTIVGPVAKDIAGTAGVLLPSFTNDSAANAQTGIAALAAAGINSAADISGNGPADPDALRDAVQLLTGTVEKLVADVEAIAKRIGL